MHEVFVRFVGFPLSSFRVLGNEHVFNEFVQLVQVQIGKNRAHHASYNVAKKVVEFEYQEEIPRHRLLNRTLCVAQTMVYVLNVLVSGSPRVGSRPCASRVGRAVW